MAITASTISSTQTLEEFRLEFNKLRSDVSSLVSNPIYGTSITFEGATADAYETTLTVVDPTADRTITLPNATGTVLLSDTNTSGYVLVADGTNYNSVAVSGDVTMSNAGAVTIASTAVEGSMLNNNVVSGLTALTSGLATTDELLISDGGTIKRMDISVLLTLTDANARAFAVALS